MKCALFFLFFITIIACQEQVDSTAQKTFDKNSKTILAYIRQKENGNMDYYMFSSRFVLCDTGINGKYSLSLDDLKKNDVELFRNYNFKILTNPIVLLPGVHPETKILDGSVRYYADWEISIPATDSTTAKSGILKMYESFDFDKDGKILYQQSYGDFGGLMMELYDEEFFEE